MSLAVIVTTRNSSRVIRDALTSIALQERLPDQVIVVDDGSTDDTKEIVNQWASTQPFETLFIPNELSHAEFPTPGPAGSRTTGMLRATSELIAILDHDDMMLPSHLRLCEEALRRNPSLELVFGDAAEFHEASEAVSKSFFSGKLIEGISYRDAGGGLRILTEDLMRYVIKGNFIPTAANMFRRETALSFGGFDRRAGGSDDVVFFSTLSRLGGVGYYPFPIARRRIHQDNMSNARHALRHVWDHLNLLFILKQNAERLHLSVDELHRLNVEAVRLEEEVLYHASRSGFSVYLDFKRRLGNLGRRRAKDVARAAVFSILSTGKKQDIPPPTRYQMVGKVELLPVEQGTRMLRAKGQAAGRGTA